MGVLILDRSGLVLKMGFFLLSIELLPLVIKFLLTILRMNWWVLIRFYIHIDIYQIQVEIENRASIITGFSLRVLK